MVKVGCEMNIETLHYYSIRDVEAIAKTFGFQTEINLGSKPGPDIILRYEKVLVYVESEVGHDTGVVKSILLNSLRDFKKE